MYVSVWICLVAGRPIAHTSCTYCRVLSVSRWYWICCSYATLCGCCWWNCAPDHTCKQPTVHLVQRYKPSGILCVTWTFPTYPHIHVVINQNTYVASVTMLRNEIYLTTDIVEMTIVIFTTHMATVINTGYDCFQMIWLAIKHTAVFCSFGYNHKTIIIIVYTFNNTV